MKLLSATMILTTMTIGATAQEATFTTQVLPSSVMGKVVKGAPYSADEITESLQMLADGTRISNQTQVTVYRDSEGRVRRESDRAITIWDPVANVSYELNPKTMKAVKSSMGRTVTGTVNGQATGNTVFYFSKEGSLLEPTRDTQKVVAEKQLAAVMLDKLKAETAANGIVVNGMKAESEKAVTVKAQLDAAQEKVFTAGMLFPVKNEALGKQSMQGISADGTRTTSTLAVGTIGNDRPIKIVSERWYSEELQTAVMTKHTDPRSGEDTFRLTNVRRGEPGADLFMMPPGYQVVESPANRVIFTPGKKLE